MTRPQKARQVHVFDSRSQPFDSWWNTLTDDQQRQAHDSIGRDVHDDLRESLVEADIFLVEAELPDGNGAHRRVWLMPTAVADFITSRWPDPTASRAERFRINAHRALDEFVTSHHSSRLDRPVEGFTPDDIDASSDRDWAAHPSVHGNAARRGTGINRQSFDLPTYE